MFIVVQYMETILLRVLCNKDPTPSSFERVPGPLFWKLTHGVWLPQVFRNKQLTISDHGSFGEQKRLMIQTASKTAPNQRKWDDM